MHAKHTTRDLERLVAIRGLVYIRRTRITSAPHHGTHTAGRRKGRTLVVGVDNRNTLQDILLQTPPHQRPFPNTRGEGGTHLEDRNSLCEQRDTCADSAGPEEDGGLVVLETSRRAVERAARKGAGKEPWVSGETEVKEVGGDGLLRSDCSESLRYKREINQRFERGQGIRVVCWVRARI